jgi:outer membrane protein assembly factor BamE (lipoprotein component of BamABCDE complex)
MRYASVVAGVVVVLAAIHFCSLEGLQGLLFSALAAEEDTIFAPDYSDTSFRAVQRGMSEAEVLGHLRSPLGEVWFYDSDKSRAAVGFSGNRVDHVSLRDELSSVDIAVGMSKSEVERLLGSPEEKTFVYSRNRGGKSYHVRVILFRGGKVIRRISEFYLD